GLIQPPSDSNNTHAEGVGAPGNLLADGSKTKYGHLPAMQTPWPIAIRELVLDPATLVLCLQHPIETPRQDQQAAHHVLRNRRRLDSARVRDEDAARPQLRQRKDPNGSGRRMNPTQMWGTVYHFRRQPRGQCDVRRFNGAHCLRIAQCVSKMDVWKPLTQPQRLDFRNLPEPDGPDRKNQDI